MTSDEIINLGFDDFIHADVETLKKWTRQISNTANRRIDRLEEFGLESSSRAYQTISGDRFGVGGKKTLNELRGEFTRAKNFLKDETSTVRGVNSLLDDLVEEWGGKGYQVDRDTVQEFAEAYEEARREISRIEDRRLRYEFFHRLETETKVEGVDILRVVEQIRYDVAAIYEERESEIIDMGEFF